MQAILHRKEMYILGSSLKNQNINKGTRYYTTISISMLIFEKGIPDLIEEMHITFAGPVAGIE